MKIGEARSIYYSNRRELTEQKKALHAQKEKADLAYKATGDSKYADDAAVLELSLENTQKAFDENQKVLDSVTDQWVNAFNMESTRQQGEAAEKMGEDMVKVMTVFRRMTHGDIVPMQDEKKLMEYDQKMYSMAKNMQTMAQQLEKERKKHDSLWEDEEKPVNPDPAEVADDTEYNGPLPDIDIPVSAGAEE
ncbi:MAG: hypothetical protein K5871_10495 [Lachnospiraceae bacterium]|nr:hypothetical protein [Lachnospiraceae bacterium]